MSEPVAKRELKPLRFAATDESRILIDEAVAPVFGLDSSEIAEWHRQLAAAPIIANARADPI